MALIDKHFSVNWKDPFLSVDWEYRDAVITGADGKEVFRQDNIEVPKDWSQLALNIVASKYFAGKIGTPDREISVRQMINRVVKKITEEGIKASYFKLDYETGLGKWAEDKSGAAFHTGSTEASTFYRELCYILVNQMASFNSPVWFNIGAKGRTQQASACFILSVDDSMEGILQWITDEGMIFKGGSGSGVNLSNLRGSSESLSTGGKASGPVSFMRGADASAGAIKSGGTTRRAAKMVILDHDHPDILEFIRCKAHEEQKAWALGDAGYDMGLNGEAWQSIQFQNANNSVRVSDNFMLAAIEGTTYPLVPRVDSKSAYDPETMDRDGYGGLNAKDVLREIAEATWICGDPGIQFDGTCNLWHTLPKNGRQRGSNPCSEYMSVDNSACNLASLNLMEFSNHDSIIDVEEFQHCVRVLITAQDILVGFSHYPTEKIARNAHAQRQLGLGYANLGALLMSKGLPYDSEEGREVAASITSLMTGTAYAHGVEIAKLLSSFEDFDKNAEAFIKVIGNHYVASKELKSVSMSVASNDAWEEAYAGAQNGYARNAQATVLAPTGTIGFMMDCQTTGIEPAIALVSYKTMVGGGFQKLVIDTVPEALTNLGYGKEEIESILNHIDLEDTIEGIDWLPDEDLSVFDCAFKSQHGTRSISPEGHIKMMGAVQPFLSGAISKTVNLPEAATVDDIMDAYILAWREGVKAIAIYRDGSKRTQPLTTKDDTKPRVLFKSGQPEIATKIDELLWIDEDDDDIIPVDVLDDDIPEPEPKVLPTRRHLPKTRVSVTHHFDISGHDGYITVGLYEDGSPGEVFVTMAKQGSTLGGLMDSFAITMSIGLQYGVPIEVYIHKLAHTRFEPSGFTGYAEIPNAKSLIDYVAKFLASKFMSYEDAEAIGVKLVQPASEAPIYATTSVYSSISDDDFDDWLESRDGEVTDEELEQLMEDLPTATISPIGDNVRTEPRRATVNSGIRADISDAPPCANCGSTTIRAGSCYTCPNCGTTTGCS